MQQKSIWRAVGLLTALGAASCSTDPGAPTARAVQGSISDAVHNNGTAGFAFLPPMVANPHLKGEFEGRVPVTVRIDRLAADGSTAATIATYTRTTGVGSEVVRVGDDHYIVNWHTGDFDLDAAVTYRIRVLVPGGRELGHADVDVVNSGRELRSVDTGEYVPLLDGRTLPIKFRLERGVVDRDGDDVFDFNDNCPTVGNADQLDTDGDQIGDACECLTVTCHPLDQCHDAGVCDSRTGDCSNPAKTDGSVCSLPNSTAACTTGACGVVSCSPSWGDCDALPDNGCETAGVGDACAVGIGACRRTGALVCAGPGATTCNAVPGEPSPEVCDGVDNDCDGQTDEEIPAISCGVGECVRTVPGCIEGVVPMCAPGTPSAEVCNNRDDDCDGASDEEIPNQVCGIGACRRTVAGCFNGVAPACVPGTATAEACNGIDDDCDGQTDEGFNLQSNNSHCGACGRVCGAGTACIAGTCTPVCPTGQTMCSGTCRNLQTDSSNCGACGRACASGQACAAGVCVGTGQLRFTMTWSLNGDMDLHVVPPCGTEIYYGRTSACSGLLDHDDTIYRGPENIYWTTGAVSGSYHVCAVPYRINGTTNFTVQVFNGTTLLETRTGTRTASTGNQVCSPSSPSYVFTYNRP